LQDALRRQQASQEPVQVSISSNVPVVAGIGSGQQAQPSVQPSFVPAQQQASLGTAQPIGGSSFQQPLQQQPFQHQPVQQQPVQQSAVGRPTARASSSSSSTSSPESSPGGETAAKPKSKLLSGEQLGLQQGPKARQQREYRFMPEGDKPFQGPPVGQQSQALGQSHPYGSIGHQATDASTSSQNRGNVPAAEGVGYAPTQQRAVSPTKEQQPSQGIASRILGALGLGKHHDQAQAETAATAPSTGTGYAAAPTGTTSAVPTDTMAAQAPPLVPTEYQQQEFEKFKQAGHIPNQQDIGQHKRERQDFKEQTGASATGTTQPTIGQTGSTRREQI